MQSLFYSNVASSETKSDVRGTYQKCSLYTSMEIKKQTLLVGFLTGVHVITQVGFVEILIVCSYFGPNSQYNFQSFRW